MAGVDNLAGEVMVWCVTEWVGGELEAHGERVKILIRIMGVREKEIVWNSKLVGCSILQSGIGSRDESECTLGLLYSKKK